MYFSTLVPVALKSLPHIIWKAPHLMLSSSTSSHTNLLVSESTKLFNPPPLLKVPTLHLYMTFLNSCNHTLDNNIVTLSYVAS